MDSILFLFVFEWRRKHVNVDSCRGQKRHSDTLDIELKDSHNGPTVYKLLGTEHMVPESMARTLN